MKKLLCIPVLLLFPMWLQSAVYYHDESYDNLKFSMYVPDNTSVIKGVYVYFQGGGGTLPEAAENFELQMLADETDFALMTGSGYGEFWGDNMNGGSGQAIESTLANFAQQSGHAEIEYSAMFFSGGSMGGMFAYSFARWKPSRVIGFMTAKGGGHETGPPGEAVKVPGYLFTGAYDKDYRSNNINEVADGGRAQGARWTLAHEPRQYHDRVRDRQKLIPDIRF